MNGTRPRIVVALGGNALLKRGERAVADVQRRNIASAAAAIAPALGSHEIVLTHGNGPQVGLLALQAESDPATPPFPLDVLGAETEGMIGYVLAQELRNHRPGLKVATVLTQVRVDADDTAFAHPGKPIGPVYEEARARALAAERGWTIAPDGAHWRRVVASPAPLEILELDAIRHLLQGGFTVICAGGGGIPVVRDAAGALHGIEAVIDKDAASALLAGSLDAEQLVMLTDVPAVMLDFGTAQARAIRRATPAALRALHFAEGSMGPKVRAAMAMAERGRQASIGALADLAEILAGRAGTTVVPDGAEPALVFA